MTWHVLAGVFVTVFAVGANRGLRRGLGPRSGLFGGLVALVVEYRLDPVGFWERNEDGLDY